jgi:hypothetical protein
MPWCTGGRHACGCRLPGCSPATPLAPGGRGRSSRRGALAGVGPGAWPLRVGAAPAYPSGGGNPRHPHRPPHALARGRAGEAAERSALSTQRIGRELPRWTPDVAVRAGSVVLHLRRARHHRHPRYHVSSGALLVIELKTEIVDVNDLVGTLDQKARLGPKIAAERGWRARKVSRWVIVSRDRTNQRRIEAHRSMLRAAFPSDGHAMRSWLANPSAPVSALSMWSAVSPIDTSPTRSQRVRAQRDGVRSR